MCYHKFTLSFGKEGVGLCYKFGKIIIRSMDGVYSENIIFTSVGRAAHREKIKSFILTVKYSIHHHHRVEFSNC